MGLDTHAFTASATMPAWWAMPNIDTPATPELLGLLSPREQEILPLLASRWTDREIADALCISYRTVTTHVSHIFDKLGITSRREAAPYALAAMARREG